MGLWFSASGLVQNSHVCCDQVSVGLLSLEHTYGGIFLESTGVAAASPQVLLPLAEVAALLEGCVVMLQGAEA